MVDYKDLGMSSKSWPFVEARKILKKINNQVPKKGYMALQTGYGPSGLPHIGTFGEVARTNMVQFAFSQLCDIPSKVIVFSDDLDGMRRIPANIPNQELLAGFIGKPLTSVPDPFGTHNSFGEHNNAKLMEFLDNFSFDYEFASATKLYRSGVFNETLLYLLRYYDDILNIMLPTLGEERRKTYSPFLPICQKTGKVLEAHVVSHNVDNGTITYVNQDNEEVETSVLDGFCKLQWKVDWAMRWIALDIDYEMFGKDLIPSAVLSSAICKKVNRNFPSQLNYELFLDKNGEKISKSKGNGLSVEQWLKYGPDYSLSYFMYQKPQTAKRLYFDVIPKNIDELLSAVTKYYHITHEEQINSPVFFIYKGKVPSYEHKISFSLILNLVSVLATVNKSVLWGFIRKYTKIASEHEDMVDHLLQYAIGYSYDFIIPHLKYRSLTAEQKLLLQSLKQQLVDITHQEFDSRILQNIVYKVAKDAQIDIKSWFVLLYESLFGTTEGPRIGSFFEVYGIDNSIKLIDDALKR